MRTKKMFTPGLVIFIGAMIAAVGAFWLYISQEKQVEATLGLITGGNSYCYFEYTSANKGQLEVSLLLTHAGDYPVYDIEADVYKADENFNQLQHLPKNVEGYIDMPPVASISRKVISPAHGKILKFGWHLGEKAKEDVLRYKFVISTRNDYFVEYLTLRKVKNEWRQAIRVFRKTDMSSVIEQHSDPDFPRNRSGNFDY